MVFIALNVVFVLYIILSLSALYVYKDTMDIPSIHHFLSHLYIVVFGLISMDLYIYKGYISPAIFTILYVIQHVSKENFRLVNYNKWTPNIKDSEL